MAIASVVDLIDLLRRHRLLAPAQLDQLPGLQAVHADPRALAGELIRRNWLTPYQVNQLFQGRGKDLVLGSYVLLQRLGEGGMGQVFKARHAKLGRVVALKLIRKDRVANQAAVRRFRREIRAAAQLSHPNIVLALDADEVNGTHFFVMEYVEGEDLARLVKRHGPLPVGLACDCVRQAALGLQHAFERGLVHRDIKPHNLLLTREGVVKVLDMGLARLDRPPDDTGPSSLMTRVGMVVGTADYIAPEQALNSHTADVRADLYSLGCTLYHLLAGRVPFAGGPATERLLRHQVEQPPPLERLRPGLPAGVAAVVRRLLAKRPQDRYQTPAELADALAALPVADPSATPPAGEGLPVAEGEWAGLTAGPAEDTVEQSLDFRPTEEAFRAMLEESRVRRRSGRRLLRAAAGGGLLVLALAVGLWVLRGRPGPQPPGPRPGGGEQLAREREEFAFRHWLESVAQLPADRQVEAVAGKLKERNPGFDGAVSTATEEGAVVRLEFRADQVTDLSPVRALAGLKALHCSAGAGGKSRLSDLSPLEGLRLSSLHCDRTQVADLSPLRGMPLEELSCDDTPVADLTPLRALALKNVSFARTRVADLAALQGMPLEAVSFNGTGVRDLAPLAGKPLKALGCAGTGVADLSPLRGLRLTELDCRETAVADLSPLRGMPLTSLLCGDTRVADLGPLQGMLLSRLACNHTGVTDLRPLQGLRLQELWCDYRPERDAEVLRSIKTLEQLNGRPAAQLLGQTGAPNPGPR
jgi:serine/threonine-protein kinase